jgi:hypothetical protein
MVKGIAWLAGLLEGDGCFQIKNGVQTIPRLQLAMLDKDIVEEVALFFKSNINEFKTPKGDKTMYRVSTAKRSVLEPLLKELYPYLGIRRQEQVRAMLAYYNQE